MIEYYYGSHALNQSHERKIKLEWADYVIKNPEYIEYLEKEKKLYCYAKIEEFGNRYLKVVLNGKSVPYRVITLHFDRRIAKKYET